MLQFFNLPRPVLIVMGILASTSILGFVYAIDYKLAGIVAIGMVFIGLVVGLFVWLRDWRARRRASNLAGDLQQHSGAAPSGINDAGQRARLDELRRTFNEGFAKFGGVENVYKFPWYLIVGEPGSGKTEAIRHCNVGFPPGLQNELQGVGGTINMNWWFTNHAVFLDTAGRLMFEEVKAGENNEWREFLGLLKRNRPTCPINGLLLIIPADSLIKDSEEEINRKAGKIAHQFDVIQRTLDIRFPVFILITKCDLLSGFREFFDDFSDAHSQHQMIGWSNRDDRDAPFRSDMVTEYIRTAVQRIEKRRLSLLRDPIPQKNQERRTDEVDALYGLPQSIQLLAPKVRSYLEKIFLAGPWSPKPLFLRGIYFTSSMREGSALDQELAQALGLRPDELRESRQWERERAYFLRDLFTEKVFRERGLVTRATNTRKMLRTRSVVLWGTGIALALLLIGSSFYFTRQLEDSVNAQSKYWAAGKNWERPGVWSPLIVPEAPGAMRSDYKGDETVLTVGSGNVSRLAFHQTLKELASQEFKTGWVFKPMLKWVRVDGDRQLAQRIVLEGGIISPLAKAARQRMLLEKIEDAPDTNLSNGARLLREANTLAALIRIESDALSKDVNLDALPKGVVEPLLVYSTARSEPLDEKSSAQLSTVLIRTYSGSFRDRSKAWPPPWLPLGSSTLTANKPIEAGLARLKALADESVKGQVAGLEQIKLLRDELRRFRQLEREMDSTAALPDPADSRALKLDALFVELGNVKNGITKKLAEALQQGVFVNSNVSLKTGYERFVGDSQSGFESAFKVTKAAVQPQLKNEQNKLFAEVDQILDSTKGRLKEQAANIFKEDEIKELLELDQYLADFGNGQRNYEVRWNSYDATHQQSVKTDRFANLIGTGWTAFSSIQAEINEVRLRIEGTRQKLSEPFARTCTFFLDRADALRPTRIAPAYLRQSHDLFDKDFFSPFVKGSEESTKKGSKESTKKGSKESKEPSGKRAYDDMREWQSDFKAEAFQKIDAGTRTTLSKFNGELEKIKRYAASLDGYVTIKYDPGRNVHGFQGSWRWNLSDNKKTDLEFTRTIQYNQSISMEFQAYQPNVPPPNPHGHAHLDALSLLKNPNVLVEGGATLELQVEPHGNPPNSQDLVDKAEVLRILR